MGEPTQRAPRTPGAARGMGNGAPSPAGAAAVPASPPVTPTRRKVPLVGPAVVVAADENTKLLSSGQKNGGRGEGGASGRGGAARSLLCGAATVVVLMLVGMAASELNLHMSKQRAKAAVPASRLSSSSFLVGQPGEEVPVVVPSGDSGSGGGLTGLLTSAAVAVAQQLGGSYFTGAGAEEAAPSRPRVPPGKWQMRCAVVNNLIFHIDVMAGWTHAFQSAGCDVTVYQNEKSLGIEDVMSAWHTGSFRKPEFFPGEAGDYHVVILPTFRDQHAELVQYLLQLPRLRKQRYFLTQHNPDWLLNHPNVDIVQQQMLTPLLDAARARQEAEEEAAEAGGGGMATLPPPHRPLLRVALSTLAPCVSNYTLHFLREMAFNLTEGQTYAERVGSFQVRGKVASGDEDGESKDNSEERRQWVAKAIDIDVPWLSPLVPWQPAATPMLVEPAAPQPAAPTALGTPRRRLQGEEGGGGAMPQYPAPPGPPPAPPGAEAEALLQQLDAHAKGGYPRHVCIQGKLENSRRNYTAAFEAISHPAVLHQLRTSGERMLLLGHRSKWETVVIPDEVADVVVVLESLPYQLYFDTLSRCRAILLAFATDEYYTKKSSSTIATAINVGVPLVAERRTLEAYTFLEPSSCFVYDDRVSAWGDDGSEEEPAEDEEEQQQEAPARRQVLDAAGGTADRQLAAKGGKGGKKQQQQQQQQQKKKQQQQKRRREEEERRRQEEERLRREEEEETAAAEDEAAAEEEAAAAEEEAAAEAAAAEEEAVAEEEDAQQEPPAEPAEPPPLPRARSYSAAILGALRAESSLAAHQAVKSLKAEVMNHNMMAAAAFIADTEGQYTPEERAADAAWWAARRLERSAAGGEAGAFGAADAQQAERRRWRRRWW